MMVQSFLRLLLQIFQIFTPEVPRSSLVPVVAPLTCSSTLLPFTGDTHDHAIANFTTTYNR